MPDDSGGFDVLGPLRAHRLGLDRPIPVGVQRVVLMALLIARRTVSGRHLLGLAWPDSVPPSGMKAVHVAISRLRGWLRSEFPGARIGRDNDSYRLDLGPWTLDAGRFESLAALGLDPGASLGTRMRNLAAALALWRGPVLDTHPVAADFPTTAGWEMTRTAAACCLADAAIDSGRHLVAVPALAALALERPTDEAVYASWGRLLTTCGRRAEAVAVLNTIRARLVDEYGLEPGPVLRAALHQVLGPGGEYVMPCGPRCEAGAG
ncbi:AfsR/SARP family transcriptional regulator [Actinokineospora diospyrosa]|uniref:DNA-binding transcriptional activator of the SARP family n=1 Tax=Actinokineospora diospyrosa TaxID=103728 RepID=A0ABT1IG17_9PSEU|nr:BTAD domain-containing putative transcriptional regulator [Actinokineospora diospyrosa]MCP2271519.1 DNA-binding transcriptional activator of the SARP family [Actinokineospora diospyrosa]